MKIIILLTFLFLAGCGMTSDSCENAVREKYSNSSIWVKSIGCFKHLVFTKDSLLLVVTTNKQNYPYISEIDTINIYNEHTTY